MRSLEIKTLNIVLWEVVPTIFYSLNNKSIGTLMDNEHNGLQLRCLCQGDSTQLCSH